jgi:hypothetical protein
MAIVCAVFVRIIEQALVSVTDFSTEIPTIAKHLQKNHPTSISALKSTLNVMLEVIPVKILICR